MAKNWDSGSTHPDTGVSDRLQALVASGELKSDPAQKAMAARWGVLFTPTLIFLPEEVAEGQTAAQAAVATMPGAFGKETTAALFTWVRDKGYENGEHFQKFLASRLNPQN